ncbi:uncharacterized protein PHALS_11757 [Plasmopara halstedii]|uniref:Uncharacterized protein n=1 Tax=Plasmopara halstedii TaxID=4781 RepID=A0A0P1AJA6_PLAHL|nr:uncharacterized protein PHALS_11757 [Plasmopara halstedii]CEG41407.1 hypothetical protein PHALS_11757 [Plasmopara halstedii]|eukprot:XP_024577776.1 hypothetical protein PHALS_11757 [Plasmopara halstedii]
MLATIPIVFSAPRGLPMMKKNHQLLCLYRLGLVSEVLQNKCVAVYVVKHNNGTPGNVQEKTRSGCGVGSTRVTSISTRRYHNSMNFIT